MNNVTKEEEEEVLHVCHKIGIKVRDCTHGIRKFP